MGASLRSNPICRTRLHGFTIIELVVVIGIMMILIGMMLPALGGAMAQSRLTRDSGILRQHVAIFELYTKDRGGIYPVASTSTNGSAQAWFHPLIDAGYFESAVEADPVAVPKYNTVRFWQTYATFYDPDRMEPGATVPEHLQETTAVRSDQLLFPSDKGVLLQIQDGPFWSEHGAHWFCCTDGDLVVPVAMGDGSVVTGDMWYFLGGSSLYMEHSIGGPVISTWGGYRARDRK